MPLSRAEACCAAPALRWVASKTAILSLLPDTAATFSPHHGLRHRAHSPGSYSLGAGMVSEVVLTFMFLVIILGATDSRAPAGTGSCLESSFP